MQFLPLTNFIPKPLLPVIDKNAVEFIKEKYSQREWKKSSTNAIIPQSNKFRDKNSPCRLENAIKIEQESERILAVKIEQAGH